MPKYTVADPNLVAQKAQADMLVANADEPMERALIQFLYVTGARPGEVAEFLYPSGWRVMDDGAVQVDIPTLKLKKKEGLQIKKRTLELLKDTPYLSDLNNYFSDLVANSTVLGDIRPFPVPQPKLIWYRVSKAAKRAGLPICPYVFRHARLTKLARSGATLDELMGWKGAEEVRSVGPYLRAKPIGRRLVIE